MKISGSLAMALACAGAACPTLAQVGTGAWRWEVSTDGGATWQTGLVHVPLTQKEVQVRPVASWSPDAGPYFNSARYDLVWEQASGEKGDSVSYAERVQRFAFWAQTLAVSRFGPIIKVDDSHDTLPPGEGAYGVLSGQRHPGFGFPDSSNPVALALFVFQLDGTPGDRLVSAIFRPSSGGNPVDRFFSVYYGPNGSANYPLSTVVNSTIRVLCPSDFNRDGRVDFFDYLDFVRAFADEDPAADYNGDGQIDFFDYLDFIETFAAGC